MVGTDETSNNLVPKNIPIGDSAYHSWVSSTDRGPLAKELGILPHKRAMPLKLASKPL